MLTCNAILSRLYQSSELQEVLSNVPEQIREDVRQHVFLELCEREEKTPGFVAGLHNRGTLKHYVARVFWNITHNARKSRNKFFKGQLTYVEISNMQAATAMLTTSQEEDEHQIDYEALVEDCAVKVDALYWYNRDLMKLYTELGSYRAVADATGLSTTSVYNAIKEAKAEVKKQLWS